VTEQWKPCDMKREFTASFGGSCGPAATCIPVSIDWQVSDLDFVCGYSTARIAKFSELVALAGIESIWIMY